MLELHMYWYDGAHGRTYVYAVDEESGRAVAKRVDGGDAP